LSIQVPTDGSVTYSGQIDYATVETSGTYEITVYGAAGGSSDSHTEPGGQGAELAGDFILTANEELEIIVGGAGGTGSHSGGGGGGTYVVEINDGTQAVDDPLIVAAGGGGATYTNEGQNAGTATDGSTPDGYSGGSGGAAVGGEGSGVGGGGGGLTGNGSDGESGTGGASFANGGAGGANPNGTYGAAGGFGGGGGGDYGGGGGGGGYTGGDNLSNYGGGGGSYLDSSGTSTITPTDALAPGQNGDGLVTFELLCFLEGTLIATPDGPRPVEDLRIGDLVLTADGAVAPVRWMGRRTLQAFGPEGYLRADPLRVMPIRIRAGALGAGLPERDLLVSPDHAILIDDILVQAGALVNGFSVVRENRLPERFTFHHVELADHALILAEGVPAETFVDNVDRLGFDNWAEHAALYGNEPSIAEMPYPRRSLIGRCRRASGRGYWRVPWRRKPPEDDRASLTPGYSRGWQDPGSASFDLTGESCRVRPHQQRHHHL
jgi:hypothetical protein